MRNTFSTTENDPFPSLDSILNSLSLEFILKGESFASIDKRVSSMRISMN